MRDTVTYLASDELEGRGDRHARGMTRRRRLHRQQFQQARPENRFPGLDGYFQTFDVDHGSAAGSGPNDAFVRRRQDASPGETDSVPIQLLRRKAVFEGPLVFVGYGDSDPRRNDYDDYAGSM